MALATVSGLNIDFSGLAAEAGIGSGKSGASASGARVNRFSSQARQTKGAAIQEQIVLTFLRRQNIDQQNVTGQAIAQLLADFPGYYPGMFVDIWA
jgi:hypothetical protein